MELTKLEEKHLDAIRDVTADTGQWGEYGGQNRESQQEAAASCTKITIEEMKGFHEWARKYTMIEDGIYLYPVYSSSRVNIDFLIQEYIKTL